MVFKIVVLACLLAFVNSAHIGLRLPESLIRIGGRVAGGHDAKVGEFPHQVSLQWGVPPSIGLSHFCGGTILNEKWILTAGHCIHAVPGYGVFAIKAGKHNINTPNEEHEQMVVAAKTFIHENYPGSVAPYDIALVKLSSPLKFNEYVRPASLPKADVDAVGKVVISGWGSVSLTPFPQYPSILQTADLEVIDLKTCNSSLEAFTKPSPLHETNLCTGPLTGGISACSGDSGGPLVHSVNGNNEVVGVVSWGMIPCGTPGAPSVFVRVSSFIDWIENIMKKNE